MSWLTQVRERVRAVLLRTSEEAQLQEEMSFHMEMEAMQRAREQGSRIWRRGVRLRSLLAVWTSTRSRCATPAG